MSMQFEKKESLRQQKMDQQISNQISSMDENQIYLSGMSSQNGTNRSSILMNENQIKFIKHNIIIDKFGAKGQQDSVQINPDLIKEVKEIGKGAAGTVWLATYYKDNQQLQVAIKQIAVDQKQSRDQFVQDLKVFLNADSPYIVKFYGCYYKEGYIAQVIEYMNMGSLRDLITLNKKFLPGPLTQNILAQISQCILKGLLYIHKSKHQIHRDIKPENILINSSGQVKLTDFGISKQLQKTLEFSRTWVGTQIYMSPERIQTSQYNSNSDVWSFGLVLYQIATNRQLPYRAGKNQIEFAVIQKIKQLPSLSFKKEDQRSPQFCHFLSRCLQKDYKIRASVQELLKHPWLINNCQSNILKPYLKKMYSQSKKHK